MPAFGMEAFARESESIRSDLLERGRRGLVDISVFSYLEVVNSSPVADPDAKGSGRLRASWTLARNTPDERFVPLPSGGGTLPAPTEENIRAEANAIQLGDEVWITNGSPCVSSTNDRTSFVDKAIAATVSFAQEVVAKLDRAILSRPSRRGRA